MLIKSTFTKFVLSYFIILIIPISIGSIVYFNAVRIAEQSSNTYNMAMLKQARSVIDSKLREVNQLSYQIVRNTKVNQFLNCTQPLSAAQRYLSIELIGDLAAYKNISTVVDDFYIFFIDSDTIFTPGATYSPRLFFDSMQKFENISYEEWIGELLSGQYFRKLITVRSGSPVTRAKGMVGCFQSIPVNSDMKADAVLVMLIDKWSISNLLSDMENANRGFVFVLDENDQIISTTGRAAEEGLRYKDFNGEEGLLYTKIDDMDMAVSYIKSQERAWKLVSVIPVETFMESANYIKELTLHVFTACLFLGLIASVFLAYRNYSPVKRLIAMALVQFNIVPGKRINEFDFIAETFGRILNINRKLMDDREQIIKENSHILSMWEEQRSIAVDSYLTRLVKGPDDDLDNILKHLKSNNIDLSSGYFCICAAYRQQPDGNARTLSLRLVEKIRAAAGRCMDKADFEIKPYAVELNSKNAVILLNVPEYGNAEAGPYGLVEEIIGHAGINEEDLFIGIGDMHRGASNIQLSYREALRALEYRAIKREQIVFYNKIPREKIVFYHYPLEVELKIINFLKSGDGFSAKNILNEIYEENINNRQLPLESVHCLTFELINTVIKVQDELNISLKEAMGDDLISEIFKISTIEETYNKIVQMYELICSYVNRNKRSHNEKLLSAVLEYVDREYTQNSISVSSIADRFGVTSSYLSRFFKEQTGSNISEYINFLRIRKVKQLLLEDDMTICDIAPKVGFSNEIVLNRVFKKLEGITPGRFRSGGSGA